MIPRVASLIEFFVLLFMKEERFQEKYSGPGPGPLAMIGVVLVVVLVGFALMAAIAIPNFLRYQLRAKSSEVMPAMLALVNAQAARANSGKGLVVFERLPADPPASKRQALSVPDQAVADDLRWTIGLSTYAQFRMAVLEDASGNRAASSASRPTWTRTGRPPRWSGSCR